VKPVDDERPESPVVATRHSEEKEEMQRSELSTGWRLELQGGDPPVRLPESIPAEVPGTVHTDLLAAGLIPDPYLDLNEEAVQWVGKTEAVYETRFDAPETGDERVDLVFEGLDTIATIELNGSIVGRTRNQHRSYRFDVRALIRPTDNRLRVTFASALEYAVEAQSRLGAMPYVGNAYPYNAIRKMASNFGWDWGPTLITAGIWKPAAVERWSHGRIVSVLAQAHADGSLAVEVNTENAVEGADESLEARITLTDPRGRIVLAVTEPVVERQARVAAAIEDAEIWWPRGYGDQPLYELVVELRSQDTAVDRRAKSIGFRDIAVEMPHDHAGVGFEFHVNDRFVYIKGANWIPDDCFLPRVTPERYRTSIADAVDAGINLLRVWGGGIYEADPFYDECGRQGILVWQDFLFACATYSEDAELATEVEAEARENVARLMSHPSLAIWNGGNENVEGYFHWGWKEKMDPDAAWGDGYYRELLPAVLAELDPERPYIPTSPFNPVNYDDPRDPDFGPVHNWEVWNRRDYTAYRDSIPRFVSEFGFQGPPTAATIAHAIHDDPLFEDSPGMRAHQKAGDGNSKLDRGLAGHLPTPNTFDDWLFATQLNQARAIRFGIEHFRSHAPRTAGSIIWQLNDCWPVVSWSAVDGEKHRKPLWYILRAVNAEHLLTIQPRDAGLALVVSNDSQDVWSTRVMVARSGFDGRALAQMSPVAVSLEPHTATTIRLDPVVSGAEDRYAEVIVASAEGAERALWYFAEDVELALPSFDADVSVKPHEGGYRVDITARGFVKDVGLGVDRLDPDAKVDRAYATLFPGETARFSVATETELDTVALARRPVLNSVNQLLHPATH
jgi:beta-mannosidase